MKILITVIIVELLNMVLAALIDDNEKSNTVWGITSMCVAVVLLLLASGALIFGKVL